MNEQQCETCRFWLPDNSHVGECRRNAPSPAMRAVLAPHDKMEHGAGFRVYWPVVSAIDLCGEWQPAGAEK